MENKINSTETVSSPKKGKSLIQLIKFALVGASNTVVDMIVNTALSFVLNLFFKGGWIVYLAKAVGYGCGLLNSYFWNSRWTFKEERRRDAREKISFVAVNIAVLLISFGLIWLFKSVFHIDSAWDARMAGEGVPGVIKKVVTGELFCSLLATCICIPVNFILNKLFVFKGKTEEVEEN